MEEIIFLWEGLWLIGDQINWLGQRDWAVVTAAVYNNHVWILSGETCKIDEQNIKNNNSHWKEEEKPSKIIIDNCVFVKIITKWSFMIKIIAYVNDKSEWLACYLTETLGGIFYLCSRKNGPKTFCHIMLYFSLDALSDERSPRLKWKYCKKMRVDQLTQLKWKEEKILADFLLGK